MEERPFREYEFHAQASTTSFRIVAICKGIAHDAMQHSKIDALPPAPMKCQQRLRHRNQAMNTFHERYGPWALILGASEGLGEAFARAAAGRGLHIALAARRAEALSACATRLENEHHVATRTIPVDLGAMSCLETLQQATEDLDLGLVVYNAAAGHIGPFVGQDLAAVENMVAVNCRGPALVAHHFSRRMIERGSGGIILMSSGAALAGGPGNALYAAGKSFELVLGEGLSRELKPHGVDVLSLIGPAIDTPNFWKEDPNVEKMLGPPLASAEVAREALEQLGQCSSWVAGKAYRDGLAALGTLPREQQIDAMEASVQAMYGPRSGSEPPKR